jgi:hypothetical protein
MWLSQIPASETPAPWADASACQPRRFAERQRGLVQEGFPGMDALAQRASTIQLMEDRLRGLEEPGSGSSKQMNVSGSGVRARPAARMRRPPEPAKSWSVPRPHQAARDKTRIVACSYEASRLGPRHECGTQMRTARCRSAQRAQLRRAARAFGRLTVADGKTCAHTEVCVCRPMIVNDLRRWIRAGDAGWARQIRQAPPQSRVRSPSPQGLLLVR